MTDQDDLIPVRALNQVTYCQRLYYLEYLESVMPINEHVEDGLFQHRRVDDPGLAESDSARMAMPFTHAAFRSVPKSWALPQSLT